MLFNDWKTYPHQVIPKKLLWEYDTDGFTANQWNNISITVTRRVIELGNRNDWYALLQLYGGPRKVIKLIRQIPQMSDIDKNFVKFAFNLKDKDLKCSIIPQ